MSMRATLSCLCLTTAGFTASLGTAAELTLDAYRVNVDDRIYRTGDIQTAAGNTISFYTNALDVEHQGVDLVLTTFWDWGSQASTDVTFAYNYNRIDVTGQRQVNGVNPVSDALVEDIENNYPESRFVATTNTTFTDAVSLMVRANWWGSHYDERGRINGDPGNISKEIDPVLYIDMELAWQVSDELTLVLGGANIFDEYPDTIDNDGVYANRVSVGLPYPRRTVTNYEGGSWYLRANYRF